MRQIVLDTETTGLSPAQGHRIIEIGCLEMVDRRLTKRSFHHYLNPGRTIDDGAIKVHGITNEFLQDKPTFKDIADDFLEFVQGSELIIHNAPFDTGFINHELHLFNKKKGTISRYCKILDTLTLARKRHPGQRNSLDALCKRYEIDNFNRELHGALLDSEILAQVYLLMTGGQDNMFADEGTSQGTTDIKNTINTLDPTRPSLTIISPTPEELAAHKDKYDW